MKVKELLEILQKLTPEELEYPISYYRYNMVESNRWVFREYKVLSVSKDSKNKTIGLFE